ncbi:MAG: hypothetical protein CMO26_07485 [Thiotrichales bacterium]|nr:hypothetical protein [Thiotrichales bacterium]
MVAERCELYPHLRDSFEYEVRHRGQHSRVVLLVDCWHPGLSETERQCLEELHPRINRKRSATSDVRAPSSTRRSTRASPTSPIWT